MADLTLNLDEKFKDSSKEDLLKVCDEEVERFSMFMSNLPDARARGALNNPEKALIKTYIVHKLRGRING